MVKDILKKGLETESRIERKSPNIVSCKKNKRNSTFSQKTLLRFVRFQCDVTSVITNLTNAFRSVIHIGITSNHLSCSRATRTCLPFYVALIRLNGARISAALVIDRH